MNEYETEPVPGLPERLPAGERMLWQGGPRWQTLARRAFHVRKVAAYFGFLMLWRWAPVLSDTGSVAGAAVSALWLVPVALLPMIALTDIAGWWALPPVLLSTAIASTRNTRTLLTIAFVPTLVLA